MGVEATETIEAAVAEFGREPGTATAAVDGEAAGAAPPPSMVKLWRQGFERAALALPLRPQSPSTPPPPSPPPPPTSPQHTETHRSTHPHKNLPP